MNRRKAAVITAALLSVLMIMTVLGGCGLTQQGANWEPLPASKPAQTSNSSTATSSETSDISSGTAENSSSVPDSSTQEPDSSEDELTYGDIYGKWYSEGGATELYVYENGVIEIDIGGDGYIGYLVYTDDDSDSFASGPRFQIFYADGTRMDGEACLTVDDAHPGKLVLIIGMGAELLQHESPFPQYYPVSARHLEDSDYKKYSAWLEITADDTEYTSGIIFETTVEVKNFQFLKISFEDINTYGGPVFKTEDILYTHPVLTPEDPFVAYMTFFGDTPTYGISFTDNTGVRYFSVSQSGLDGSVVLSEYWPG